MDFENRKKQIICNFCAGRSATAQAAALVMGTIPWASTISAYVMIAERVGPSEWPLGWEARLLVTDVNNVTILYSPEASVVDQCTNPTALKYRIFINKITVHL